MGNAACVIIIDCGALKSKAAALELYPYEILKPVAHEMFEFESELCDNAETLTASLDDVDREKLFGQAAQAWAFGVAMRGFMNRHRADLIAPHANQDSDDVAVFADNMRLFLDAQMELFRSFADKYKDGAQP